MRAELTELIEKYTNASNKNNKAEFVSCFAEDAEVTDENKTIKGRDAIGKWFESAKEMYSHKMRLIEVNETANGCLMTAEVSGNFEGSPVDLNYNITVQAGLITGLRID